VFVFAMIGRLSRILDYLTDNIYADILSRMVGGVQEESERTARPIPKLGISRGCRAWFANSRRASHELGLRMRSAPPKPKCGLNAPPAARPSHGEISNTVP
jgi:hypothetical protein